MFSSSQDTFGTTGSMRKIRTRLPPLNAVKAFEAVARLGSVTQAASELNVTPSAVSQQIRLLEEYVGRKLFVMQRQGLELTDTSTHAITDISHAMDLIARAFRPADPLNSRLAISTVPVVASRWLNPRMSAFLAEHPQVEMHVDSSPRLVDFSNESFDMALRFGLGKYGRLSVDPLFTERFRAVCSPSLKNQIEEQIKEQRFNTINFICDVGMHTGEHVTWADWFERRGFPSQMPERKIVCNDANMSIDAAVNGCGLLLGRHALISSPLEQGTLVPLAEQPFETGLGYFLVYPSFVGLSPIARLLRSWLLERAAETREQLQAIAA